MNNLFKTKNISLEIKDSGALSTKTNRVNPLSVASINKSPSGDLTVSVKYDMLITLRDNH